MSYHIIHDLFFHLLVEFFIDRNPATTFKPPGGRRSGSRTTLGHLFSGRLGWGIPSLDFEVWKSTIELGSLREVLKNGQQIEFFLKCLSVVFVFDFLVFVVVVVFLCFPNLQQQKMPKDISPLQNLCTRCT